MPEYVQYDASDTAKKEIEYEQRLDELDKEGTFYALFLQILGTVFIVISVWLLLKDSQLYFSKVIFFDITGIIFIIAAEYQLWSERKRRQENKRNKELEMNIRESHRDYQM